MRQNLVIKSAGQRSLPSGIFKLQCQLAQPILEKSNSASELFLSWRAGLPFRVVTFPLPAASSGKLRNNVPFGSSTRLGTSFLFCNQTGQLVRRRASKQCFSISGLGKREPVSQRGMNNSGCSTDRRASHSVGWLPNHTRLWELCTLLLKKGGSYVQHRPVLLTTPSFFKLYFKQHFSKRNHVFHLKI